MTRTQEDQQELVIVLVVQIGGLLEQGAQFQDGSLADFRRFAQFFPGELEQLLGRWIRVDVELLGHIGWMGVMRQLDQFGFFEDQRGFLFYSLLF